MNKTPPAPPPIIFSPSRRRAARQRMRTLQQQPDAVRFIYDDVVEDMLERLGFLRHEPRKVLVVGDRFAALTTALAGMGAQVTRADAVPGPDEIFLDEDQPYPFHGFDLIASISSLDTINDLPGALIHIRHALAPGGVALLSFVGAGSLPTLRGVMLEADGDRPAARIHPMVDVRAGAELMQRTGFAEPVADSRTIRLTYRSLDQLVADLRAQALGNVLAASAPPLGKAAFARAKASFAALADSNGRVAESIEILTLSGQRPTGTGATAKRRPPIPF